MSQRTSDTSNGRGRAAGAGWTAWLRYAFDNAMSRGTSALVAWLFLLTILLVGFFVVLDLTLGLRDHRSGFWAESFQDVIHALDPGTVAGDQGSWKLLLAMLVLTIAGLFLVSALIGVIAAGIDARIADLRRGRSVVLESDHTVVLGWSDSIYTIVRELTVAGQSRRRPVIAILADRDKVEMEELLRAKVPERRGTRIVCRSGSPMDVDDLSIVRPQTARSVIVVSADKHAACDAAGFDPDAEVIKVLLALRSADVMTPAGARPASNRARVVAELRDPANLAAARLVDADPSADRTSLVDIRETIAKMVVQTSRQSGAAAVYRELLDYEGDEIYFFGDHRLADASYAEARLAFETLSVIGLNGPEGSVLNPPGGVPIGGRSLIVVAEDDAVLAAATRSSALIDTSAFSEVQPEPPHPTHAVLLGWNDHASVVVRELDDYAPPGSTLTVVTTYGDAAVPVTRNLELEVVHARTTDRSVLEQHVVGDLDQVIVLCYTDHLAAEQADATTLITLLHVRDILARYGATTAVVSEMIDDRNRVLAQVADIDDVIVSGEIVSLVLTQLAEDARIEPVLEGLLHAEGAEIYLRPAEWYVRCGVEVSWATVVAAAGLGNETALGFTSTRLAGPGASFGVVINPAKSEPVTMGEGDRIVVLADS